MKAAASPKSSKTDGRALLANSSTLRNEKLLEKAAVTAAVKEAVDADSDGAQKDDNNNAVVASGFVVVADYTDKVAANGFFTPGRIFAARVKHSSFPGKLCHFF